MTITAIIVAAGRGTRAGAGQPKQYRPLAGRAVLNHSIRAVLADPRVTQALVVIHPDDLAAYHDAVADLSDDRIMAPVFGGETRSASVLNGLDAATGEFVLIHDGARPLLDAARLGDLIDAVLAHGAAFLALPVTDAIWDVVDGVAQSALPRDTIWRAQTPQGFNRNTITAAYKTATGPAADDVAIAMAAGLDVTPVHGSERNIKITQAQDFDLAEKLMGRTMDIRVGNGFDVHKFGPGSHVVLCGVHIPHDMGLLGHSDADVAMHAVTDAIFGALAKGDIGQWFPPSDPQWKGAASDIFLRKAMSVAAQDGFRVNHIDCTLICEMPKIGPHATAMRTALAEITGIDMERISVKATTSEKLGFTGRGEGIAASATATLVAI